MEGNPEVKPENTQPAAVHHYGKKRFNPSLIFLIAGIVVLIAVVVLIFALKGHSSTATNATEIEKINLSYSIALENGTVIGSGANVFDAGKVASGLSLKTSKLDTEIASMKDGAEKNITLDAADAYGAYDEKLVFSQNRTLNEFNRSQEWNRTVSVSISDFKDTFDEQPMVNKTYSVNQSVMKYKVLEVNESAAKLSLELAAGDEISSGLYDYNFKVQNLTDEKIFMKLEGEDKSYPLPETVGKGNVDVKFTDNKITMILSPELGSMLTMPNMPKASVKEIKDTIILLDANSDLAGKKVIVTVKVISRSKEKSAAATGASVVDGAPTMQVFIMSHCPYGTQILKGLIPVMEKFNGKANVELRFVSYTMHGAQEELDNKRIICMREEQSSKLTDYLNCYVSGSGSEEDTQKCIAKVDKAKLDSCVASKADTYLEADKALNTEYGVQGSPTIVINGKEASIGRDSQSLATALCNAFTGSKPSVCSETFSTTSPSPGFGTSASSSSGGSCGA